jgi:hypothetical protein
VPVGTPETDLAPGSLARLGKLLLPGMARTSEESDWGCLMYYSAAVAILAAFGATALPYDGAFLLCITADEREIRVGLP